MVFLVYLCVMFLIGGGCVLDLHVSLCIFACIYFVLFCFTFCVFWWLVMAPGLLIRILRELGVGSGNSYTILYIFL